MAFRGKRRTVLGWLPSWSITGGCWALMAIGRCVDVELVLEEQRVAIPLKSVAGAVFSCSGCGEKCSLKDHAKQREWRHMDTMQFETVMRARVPRTDCPQCGVKTCAVPWADLHGRFTLMFEAFAVRVLQAASSVEQASQLLGLNWKGLHRIMERAVECGLAKRELDEVEPVGMDEKSFGRGHDYVSVMTDIDGARVLEPVKKVARMLKRAHLKTTTAAFTHRVA